MAVKTLSLQQLQRLTDAALVNRLISLATHQGITKNIVQATESATTKANGERLLQKLAMDIEETADEIKDRLDRATR